MGTSKNDSVKRPGVGLHSALTATQVSLVKSFLVFVFFTAFTLVIYSSTFTSPFILDDLIRIDENPAIRVGEFSIPLIIKAGFNSSKTRPLAFISFALNHSLHQYDVFGYHVLNISIHILAGFFLYLFIKTTFRTPALQGRYRHTDRIAFFAALIWLAHPIQTEAVTYIVQRMTSMASMFFILSLLFYAYGRLAENRRKTWFWLIASAASWLLSLGCKQITATLPLVVFLYEWYFFQDLSKQWFRRNLKYLLGVIAFFALLFLIYTGFSPWEKIKSLHDYARHEFSMAQRLLTQFRVIIHYISLILLPLPARLNLDYDFVLSQSLIDPFTTLLSMMAIGTMMAFAFYLAKKNRLISFCILWFFANHLIESSILPLAIIFEHRNYLPTMMVGLIPVVLAYRYLKLDWLTVGLLGLLVLGLAVGTYQRNRVWENELTLWSDVVKKSPHKARPHVNLGLALVNREMVDKGIAHYQKALQADPNYYESHVNWGKALADRGETDAAIEHYLAALRIKPSNAVVHNNLGAAWYKKGQFDKAINHFLTALQIRQSYADAHFGLGVVRAHQGKTDEAASHFYRALRIDPHHAEAHNNLAGMLAQRGQTEKAIGHYSAALRLNPQLVEAYNNLGTALMQEGKIAEAVGKFRQALQIRPGFELAENNLKRALAIQKAIAKEISRYQQSLNNDPDNPQLHFELGNLYFRSGDRSRAVQQYNRALQIDNGYVPALSNLALVYAANKDYDSALTSFFDVLKYRPDDAKTHYNVACMYSRLNRVDDSIAWLKKAIDKGYTNWESIKKDSDLDNIRDSSGYRELVKDH